MLLLPSNLRLMRPRKVQLTLLLHLRLLLLKPQHRRLTLTLATPLTKRPSLPSSPKHRRKLRAPRRQHLRNKQQLTPIPLALMRL